MASGIIPARQKTCGGSGSCQLDKTGPGYSTANHAKYAKQTGKPPFCHLPRLGTIWCEWAGLPGNAEKGGGSLPSLLVRGDKAQNNVAARP
jgi:hypothetical protein